MAAIKYEPLTGLSDFRLLKLQPGLGAEPLVSNLLLSSLDDRSYRWHALSYTWGDPYDCRVLTCDGYQVSITANLHSALQRLRLADKPILVWADAICINQGDKEEKEAQVQLMRHIFTRADLVVADVGEAGDDYDDVATIFNALMDIIKTVPWFEQIDYEKYKMFGLPEFTDRKWESWRKFLARPWFRRVWVAQEYALAWNVNMMYGTMNLHGEALPALMPEIARNIHPHIVAGAESYTQQNNANLNCAAMSAMLSARRDIQAGRSRGLLHHLRYLSSFCDAPDKRDKVYALLGLATDAERSALRVNYSESTAEVYHRTAKVLIEQGNGIEVLYEAASYDYLDGLPSWAPNWAGNRVSESLGWATSSGWADGAEEVKTFRATGSARRTMKIGADGRSLHVRGIYLDSIQAIIKPVKEDLAASASLDFGSGRGKYVWDFEGACDTLVYRYQDSLRYPPGEGLTNALWRTLICDMTKDVAENLIRPAPSSFALCYLAFLRLKDLMVNPDRDAVFRDNAETIKEMVRESGRFISAFEPVAHGRRFCVTQDGYMGLIPTRAAKGDGICVFLGARCRL